MTSEIFEEIFQLIKDDIPKDNAHLRELIPPKLYLLPLLVFINRVVIQELWL